MKGIFRPVEASELSPGWWTSARVRSELGCVINNFRSLRCEPDRPPRRVLNLAGGWWYAKHSIRSFAVNACDFCRRDLRTHQAFMRRGVRVDGEAS